MFKAAWLMVCILWSFSFAAEEISVDYQLMDREMFESSVIGNTVMGVTRQSHSVYFLHFLPEGECELWKQNQIYQGKWWIERDHLERDVIRAFWPDYTSLEKGSLFSPENPRYGTATSLLYYIHPETKTLLLLSKKRVSAALLISDRPYAQIH